MFKKTLLNIFLFFTTIFEVLAIDIIRDDEIEDALRMISAPIFRAARQNPNSVTFYIVNDNSINAFTAGGMSIFLNVGLLTKFDDPSVVQGVIAHEYGHILAGHVVQKSVEYRDIKKAWILTSILGAMGSAVSGSPNAIIAGTAGADHYLQQKLLAYSRTHESEADHIALDLLRKSKFSNHGLMDLLKIISVREQSANIPTYFLTHPSGQWRINYIKSYNQRNSISGEQEFTQEQKNIYHLAMVKLIAFTEKPNVILKKQYNNETDRLYSHAIAYYRLKNNNSALENLQKLIILYPENPYYYELAAQVYQENGNAEKAVENYEIAHRLLPKSELIRYQLAVSYTQNADKNGKTELYKKAIRLLNQIIIDNHENEMIYHYLATCYGKIDNLGMARLSLAEKALIQENKTQAIKFAKQALILLKQTNQDIFRAEEIIKSEK